ncbi:sensor domain-containing diguanylate cyclase [Noviherbaspirillum suwonense]|uniref:diguanylate cyclase n=1 Tax=Noviherbaspirillum suwonense TaxID=1224511 RepID=A0ABY1QMC4_9BURK|nr:sensor domain-containing diguanylate cyclase [Noviherbaspirillum suwonense]SMP74058.1 diguanylate cyclase (GGDEF) domain-containing protein [Noviherbaspirillum suwonense]
MTPGGDAPAGNAKRNAILFVLLVALTLIGMGCWTLWKARVLQMEEASTATANMTKALSQHADDTFRAADSMLLGVVERLEVDGMAGVSLPRLHNLLKASVAQLSSLEGMFVFDQEGRTMVNALSVRPARAGNADREYFVYHKANLDQSAHVGAPTESLTTGRWVVPISRRINHPDGTFAGVVLATVDMAYFRQFHQSFDIGANGTILLALDDGTVLLRRPFKADLVGANVGKGPVFTQLRANGPGTAMLQSVVDQVVRVYSYEHVRHYPLVVATAFAKDDIFAGWQQEALQTAAVILALIAVLSGCGLHLVRQISVRERVEAELRDAKYTLERMNRSLELLSLQDSLTGLGNRRRFDLALQAECRHSMRHQTPLALVMIDVDHFKRYNDLYGHPAGDECLRRIGAAVSAARGRASDVVARYGGEEIAVLLPQTQAAGALAAAERVREAVEAIAIQHAGSPVGHVTVSIGVATLAQGEHPDAPALLLREADRALYEAKAAGRNQVRLAAPAGRVDEGILTADN